MMNVIPNEILHTMLSYLTYNQREKISRISKIFYFLTKTFLTYPESYKFVKSFKVSKYARNIKVNKNNEITIFNVKNKLQIYNINGHFLRKIDLKFNLHR